MAAANERCFGVTNIKHHIPLILDLEDHNYDAWRELFQTHCMAFDVLGHLDGTLLPTGDADTAWHKRDGLVKLWLYGTLAQPLFKSSFKTGGSARDIWLRVENQFRNNKEARAIQLDNELRTMEIGDMTIRDYCQKLKSVADLLTNVDAPVNERTLVMYLLNGLNEKFDNIINVIKHKEPFPSFDSAKSMLELEETRIKKVPRSSASHKDNSSSSTALTVAASSPHQSDLHRFNNNNRGNNNRGRRFNNRGRGGRGNNRSSWSPQWSPQPYWPSPPPYWPQYPPWSQPSHSRFPQSAPPQSQPQANFVEFQQPFQSYVTESLNDPSASEWFMDTGATAHLTPTAGILNSNLNHSTGNSVIVGNGSSIPITSSGNTTIPSKTKPLLLQNVLVAPKIVKNLISVRKFTKDNWCSVDFDPFGFTVKDLPSRKVLLRCESSGDLYSLPASFNKTPNSSPTALLASTPELWHKRLGHVHNSSLSSILNSNPSLCTKGPVPLTCEPCILGKSIKQPFFASHTKVHKPFELVHSDLWTSPLPSISGIRYYVLFLDHYSHFLWVYPLRRKSETFSKFLHFSAHIATQFKAQIKNFQCDNGGGGEYNNTQFHSHFATHGINVRFSCPHSSQQNGKSERMIRTINNAIRTLLFQARLPPSYWVEALHAAVHVLNITPSKAIHNQIPFQLLFQKQPTYEHLRVFGCLCFPNINHSNLTKLSARSTPCLFLGYPSQHRGYRCMDLKTRKIIISRHVIFDETKFPAAEPITPPISYTFLDDNDDTSPQFQSILQAPFQTPTSPPTPTPPPPPPATAPPLPPRHNMTTRSKAGISKPKQVLSLITKTKSPLPKSHLQALSDPNWNPAMTDEHGAMLKTKTWDLLMGFVQSKADSSLYIFRRGRECAYLLLYVDDILLTASSTLLLQKIISKLKTEFPMTDMGKLHHFLGVKADFNDKGLFLSQSVYAQDIITRAGMVDCKPLATLVDLQSKLSITDGELIDNPTFYRSLAGALQYLTFTHPDISYAVHQVCLYMHQPRVPHLHALKRIIRYLQGTLQFGIQMTRGNIDTLTAYSDADWAGCPDTRRSTSGYCVCLGPNLISWSAKRQPTPSRSSTEA
ncbi:unnamed protein product [Arabidopsis halleri]